MGDTTLLDMAMKRRNDEIRAEGWSLVDVIAIPVSLVLFLILALWVVVIVITANGLLLYEKLNHRPDAKATRNI